MSFRQKLIFVLVLLAAASFMLSWKFFIAPDRLAGSPDYQRTINITSENLLRPAESPDDALRIYGVNVVHTRPFKDPFFGYGIYLGNGVVLTAAHVLGRLSGYTKPHVIIAGQDLPAKIITQGSADEIDLALLLVDQARLPVSLRLRRNPLCRGAVQVRSNVVVVYPERTVRSRIMSPSQIAPQFRGKFATLIDEAQGSGSGVFDADKHCLIGIMTRRIIKYAAQPTGPFRAARPDGWAGYFVPVSALRKLSPSGTHF